MNKKYLTSIFTVSIICVFIISGCTITFIRDNSIISSALPKYDFEHSNNIVHLYVTILDEQPNDDPRYSYTFDQLNEMGREESMEKDPRFNVIMQEGSASGPEEGYFAFSQTSENAVLKMRGNFTRGDAQKSYKITLNDNLELWNEQQILNLNKHMYDFSRVRNKLSFDYFTFIPNLISLRTQFVYLHVKDLSSGLKQDNFTDYGLYTHFENVDQRYLESSGLDPYAHLYKANNFAFYRYPESLKLTTDLEYSEEEFEHILSIKGSEDHRKLLNMLDEVNDYSLDFDKVFEKHFDRDNYFTWLAVNILFGNLDTISLNFYLYSPSNSRKWYFIPWDYDRSWGNFENYGTHKLRVEPWKDGLTNWWGGGLHIRVFQNPKNIIELTEKVESLGVIVNERKTKELLDGYFNTVNQYVKQSPDLEYLTANPDRYKEEYYKIVGMAEYYKQNYYKKLEIPMPFRLGQPHIIDGKLSFAWDASYDIQGDDLFYDFQISNDPEFNNIYYKADNLQVTEHQIDPLPIGVYYWRVIVKDIKSNTQIAFNNYTNENGRYFGIDQFVVE